MKILKVFNEYKIPLAGFFASDEFVRGHFFEGHKVHKLSEIEDAVKNFVIVLAFACGYESLIEKADIIHLSTIHVEVEGDIKFPILPEGFNLVFEQFFVSNINYTYQIWKKG